MSTPGHLGTGLGWRPEIGVVVQRLEPDFVEVIAENLDRENIPEPIRDLRSGGVPVLPHAVSLSLGGSEHPAPGTLAGLAAVAEALDAPLISDHVAFVRAGGLEAGHLLPVPRTRDALGVLIGNVRRAQEQLPVPLALENIAALLAWPDAELTEEQFLNELVERTGCLLIVDVANLYANAHNIGTDPQRFLDSIPLERVAYAHIAGGVWRDGLYHDTHAHPVLPEVLDLLAQVCTRAAPPGVLLERDDNFPPDTELADELARIRRVLDQHDHAGA